MPKSKKQSLTAKKPLDRGFWEPAKRGPGRPVRVIPSEITGRAENYRWILNQVWETLWPRLSGANSEEGVVRAIQEASSPYQNEFVFIQKLVLPILRERRFPRTREAQINFLADSLAALGRVSARRSRDICAEFRVQQKRETHIISWEYWITCSCRYKGRSRNRACPKCGAKVPSNTGAIIGTTVFGET
jgi:hypothetical protein